MAQVIKLLPHQARFVQAPYVFEDTRFFFLIGGYACGKTSSLVYATMKAVKELLGKYDKEHHNPKILIGSKNITFLSKTFTNALVQNLQNTTSQFTYDKARNIITIGNVELILIGLEDPSTIYGYSCACFRGDTLVATEKGDIPIKDLKIGDKVLTTKGFKKLKAVKNQGLRECIKVTVDDTDIICTPDHKFIDCFDNEIEAKNLTKTTSLVKLNTKEWQKWLNTNGEIEQSQRLLTSMVFATTGIQNQNLTEKGAITLARMKTRKKVSQLCIEICGLLNMEQFQKDLTYTTKMAILSTTLLRTLNLLQELNTQKNIGDFNQRLSENRLLNQLKRLKKDTENFLKIQSIERNFLKEQKKQWRNSHITVNALCVENLLWHTINAVFTVLLSVREQQVTGNKILETRLHHTEWKKFVKSVVERLKQVNMHWLQLAHLTAKTSNVVGQYTVYDIEVEDCHEFFANGVRVHNCAIIDELDELPTNVAMEAVKSVNDRIRQQIEGFREPFLAFATTSQGLKGLYQTVLHFKKNGIGYVLMRARTKDNTFLPKDYVKNMYSIYNEKERKCLLEGEFISIDSGLVYPDYNPVLNKLDVDLYDSIEENDTVYVGNDFNSFGNAGVACIVKQGAIVIIKDYTFPDVRRIPEILRYDFPTQKIVWIPDATATAIYTQYKKELRLHNIKIAYRKSNPLVQDRVFAINKLLHAQKLFVCPMCKEVEHTFLTHQKDAKTGMPTKGGQGAPDHHGDACSYAVYHILCWCREMKDLYNITLGRRKMTRLGSVGQEVDADYKLLNPDKIALELPENVAENLNPS